MEFSRDFKNDYTGSKRKRNTSNNSAGTDSEEENRPPSKRKYFFTDMSSESSEFEPHLKLSYKEINQDQPIPLPRMSWADKIELWKDMVIKDHLFSKKRDPLIFENHPALTARMRTILLDWLSEVCEVYRMHRETYFLAIDFLDRYLSNTQDLPKAQLQLLGITCLFIASKIEEIYPPKLNEFAYVTDGACTEKEIILRELIILKELDWDLTPMTINYWLIVYMQMHKYKSDSVVPVRVENTFVYPQYSVMDYEQAITLCTLAAWDVEMLKFSYRTIAAASLFYISDYKTALTISQLSWTELKPCVDWMYPFALVMKDNCFETVYLSRTRYSCGRTGLQRSIPDIHIDESHILQKHSVNIDLFHQAISMSPKTPSKTDLLGDTRAKKVMLTPPTSGRKSADE